MFYFKLNDVFGNLHIKFKKRQYLLLLNEGENLTSCVS